MKKQKHTFETIKVIPKLDQSYDVEFYSVEVKSFT